MAESEKLSFRILHPDPVDFFRSVSLAPDLHCQMEFSSSSSASQFQKILHGLSYLRQVRLEGPKPFRVSWSVPWAQSFLIHKSLMGLPLIARQIEQGLKGYNQEGFWKLMIKNKEYSWNRRTQIMGVLNITPDSFSDGGRYLDPAKALEQALRLEKEGADWIDVGGESTRPGARAVSVAEEMKRVLPVLRACAKKLRIPISIDTYKSEVARAAVSEGAQMINDISAMTLDERMAKTIASLKVPVVLMHMKGKPRTMQKNAVYSDVVGEVLFYLRERLEAARQAGIAEERLVVDPGLGFGKTDTHNLELLRRLWEFKVLGKPILSGPSRKSMIGRLLGGLPSDQRVEGTAAAVTVSVLKGADFVRVHDVQSVVRVVKIADAIRYGG